MLERQVQHECPKCLGRGSYTQTRKGLAVAGIAVIRCSCLAGRMVAASAPRLALAR